MYSYCPRLTAAVPELLNSHALAAWAAFPGQLYTEQMDKKQEHDWKCSEVSKQGEKHLKLF